MKSTLYKYGSINNWEELQEEKSRIEALLESREKVIEQRVSRIKENGRHVLLYKVLFPLGAVGLGAAVAKLFGGDQTPDTPKSSFNKSNAGHIREETDSSWFNAENIDIVAKVLKTMVPVLLTYLAQRSTEDPSE